jgi:hypothetical protein
MKRRSKHLSTDTIADSLVRARALSADVVFDAHANAYLPVLDGYAKRPIISTITRISFDADGAFRAAEHFPVTVDRDGGRTAYNDGHVTYPTEALETTRERVAAMNLAFATAPLSQNYLARVAYQPLSAFGLAVRVQDAFGHGNLYKVSGTDLVFVPDPSIPSRLVREALQTVALDRIVDESIRAESALVADRHLAGDPVCAELRHIPRGCLTRDVQAAYVSILRGVLETPGYRDEVGDELPELF